MMMDFSYQKQEAAALARYQARAAARAHTLQVLENASPIAGIVIEGPQDIRLGRS
jgi:hypothetical protein